MICSQSNNACYIKENENHPLFQNTLFKTMDTSQNTFQNEIDSNHFDNTSKIGNYANEMNDEKNLITNKDSKKLKTNDVKNNYNNDAICNNFYFNKDTEFDSKPRNDFRKRKNHNINCNFPSPNSASHNSCKRWTPNEDNRLREAVEIFGDLNWRRISNYLGTGKTRSQCSQRWNRCLDPHISKEKWSTDDINHLKELVFQYGDHSWAKIASKMTNRCDVQCRYMYKKLTNSKVHNAAVEDLEMNDLDMFLKSDQQNSVNNEFSQNQMSLQIGHDENMVEKINSNEKENVEMVFDKDLIIDLFPPEHLNEENTELNLNLVDMFM
ncbi:hypothetical protein M9Y10_003161 [Tritrichomonas musculus]|uniref:Myb-like DNA-binding domain containing protein n=1 Tax=Tritrichomonas musculus TaxID=1915356 RepID=A0ABR2JNS2_9EUKA